MEFVRKVSRHWNEERLKPCKRSLAQNQLGSEQASYKKHTSPQEPAPRETQIPDKPGIVKIPRQIETESEQITNGAEEDDFNISLSELEAEILQQRALQNDSFWSISDFGDDDARVTSTNVIFSVNLKDVDRNVTSSAPPVISRKYTPPSEVNFSQSTVSQLHEDDGRTNANVLEQEISREKRSHSSKVDGSEPRTVSKNNKSKQSEHEMSSRKTTFSSRSTHSKQKKDPNTTANGTDQVLSDFQQLMADGSLKTRSDLEEFVRRKICEGIMNSCDGEVHLNLRKQQQTIKTLKQDLKSVSLQAKNLTFTNRKLLREITALKRQIGSNTLPIVPTKITRSVGQQVNFDAKRSRTEIVYEPSRTNVRVTPFPPKPIPARNKRRHSTTSVTTNSNQNTNSIVPLNRSGSTAINSVTQLETISLDSDDESFDRNKTTLNKPSSSKSTAKEISCLLTNNKQTTNIAIVSNRSKTPAVTKTQSPTPLETINLESDNEDMHSYTTTPNKQSTSKSTANEISCLPDKVGHERSSNISLVSNRSKSPAVTKTQSPTPLETINLESDVDMIDSHKTTTVNKQSNLQTTIPTQMSCLPNKTSYNQIVSSTTNIGFKVVDPVVTNQRIAQREEYIFQALAKERKQFDNKNEIRTKPTHTHESAKNSQIKNNQTEIAKLIITRDHENIAKTMAAAADREQNARLALQEMYRSKTQLNNHTVPADSGVTDQSIAQRGEHTSQTSAKERKQFDKKNEIRTKPTHTHESAKNSQNKNNQTEIEKLSITRDHENIAKTMAAAADREQNARLALQEMYRSKTQLNNHTVPADSGVTDESIAQRGEHTSQTSAKERKQFDKKNEIRTKPTHTHESDKNSQNKNNQTEIAKLSITRDHENIAKTMAAAADREQNARLALQEMYRSKTQLNNHTVPSDPGVTDHSIAQREEYISQTLAKERKQFDKKNEIRTKPTHTHESAKNSQNKNNQTEIAKLSITRDHENIAKTMAAGADREQNARLALQEMYRSKTQLNNHTVPSDPGVTDHSIAQREEYISQTLAKERKQFDKKNEIRTKPTHTHESAKNSQIKNNQTEIAKLSITRDHENIAKTMAAAADREQNARLALQEMYRSKTQLNNHTVPADSGVTDQSIAQRGEYISETLAKETKQMNTKPTHEAAINLSNKNNKTETTKLNTTRDHGNIGETTSEAGSRHPKEKPTSQERLSRPKTPLEKGADQESGGNGIVEFNRNGSLVKKTVSKSNCDISKVELSMAKDLTMATKSRATSFNHSEERNTPGSSWPRHPYPLYNIQRTTPDPRLKPTLPKPHIAIAQKKCLSINWNMPYDLDLYEDIAAYQLYAYEETDRPPREEMWKQVSEIKALGLPMACSLSDTAPNAKFYFALRAVDVYRRVGEFSDILGIRF